MEFLDKLIRISIANDFSQTPGARYRTDGPKSGEEFRESILEKYFTQEFEGFTIEVDLDGVKGYTTSFLEEAFGGLVRKFGKKIVEERLRIISIQKKYRDKAIEYINNASQK